MVKPGSAGDVTRRKPRDFLITPEHFGRRSETPWVKPPVDEGERRRLAAAYFQHRVAYEVLEAIAVDRSLTVERFAQRVGMKTDTLKRKLYGADVARLEEILEWAYQMGVHVLPVIQEREQLYPPQD